MRTELRCRERGFTLIEVLVAMVVTSLLLAIVMNAALTAKARARATEAKQGAVALAASLVAERTAAPFVEEDTQGENGELRWRVSERALENDPRGLFVLAEIGVRIESVKGVALFDAATRKLKAIRRQ